MSLRPGLVACLAVVTVTGGSIVANAELSCQSVSASSLMQRTQVQPTVRLERIRGSELIDGERRVKRLRHESELYLSRFGVRRIARRIPNLWRRQIPLNVSPAALRVKHRLKSNGAETSAAVAESNVRHRLPIVIRRIRPRVLCKRNGQQLVEGGVILEFPLASLPAMGRYQVEIETSVELP